MSKGILRTKNLRTNGRLTSLMRTFSMIPLALVIRIRTTARSHVSALIVDCCYRRLSLCARARPTCSRTGELVHSCGTSIIAQSNTVCPPSPSPSHCRCLCPRMLVSALVSACALVRAVLLRAAEARASRGLPHVRRALRALRQPRRALLRMSSLSTLLV